jgi:hypothetical protein
MPCVWWLLVLLAQVEHPPQKSDAISATLSVSVPERVDRHSPPRLTLEVKIQGPDTLQAEAAQLGEEVRSWTVTRTTQRIPQAEGVQIIETLKIEQNRPGLQSVPGVRVRAWTDPGSPCLFEWPNPLGTVVASLEPDIPLPEPPARSWTWPLVGTVGLLALLGLGLWWWLRRTPPTGPLTPEERAEATLRELAVVSAWTETRQAATRLSTTLREYLIQRTGLDLHARTVSECIARLREQSPLDPERLATLERILQWCDATRFADHGGPNPEGPALAVQALRWIGEVSQPGEPARENG